MRWWVQDVFEHQGAAALVSWIFWVLLSITLHELGHAWAAVKQGDRTPIEQDRITLNPVVHMGPQSLLIFALCGIAWGAMPVNPYRFRDGRVGEAIVAVAGPAVNLALAVACVLLLGAWRDLGPNAGTLAEFVDTALRTGAFLNIFLAVLNLIPIPPLDGSRIVAAWSMRARELFNRPEATMVAMFLFIAIFFMTPIGSILWALADFATEVGVNAVRAIIPG